ncbi:MAG: hypothetical protein WCA35_25310 [Kovacikia sp.]
MTQFSSTMAGILVSILSTKPIATDVSYQTTDAETLLVPCHASVSVNRWTPAL